VYDPSGNSWTSLSPMPAARHHAVAAVVNGKIYVIGGLSGATQFIAQNTLFEFDPQSSTWAVKATLPMPRGAAMAGVINGRIFVAGGQRNSLAVTDCASYNPADNTWTTLANMPAPREHAVGGVINGKLYVAGGRNSTSFILNTLEVYDPVANTWSTLTPMPTARSGMAGAVWNNRLIVFGGEGSSPNPPGVFSQVEMYDEASELWITLPSMQTPRHGFGGATLGNKVYLQGGGTQQGIFDSTTHEVLDLTPVS
ncbi:MAG: Kelch repeat-containing protein, partial [bacterium]